MLLTIKQLAESAGVSTRTLRHYHQIGLLMPAKIGENGYRYYGSSQVLLLQQILFFRSLELPLEEIKTVLQNPDFNCDAALVKHRDILQKKKAQIETLIVTINQTLTSLKKGETMNTKAYFKGFDDTEFAEEARKRWGQTDSYKTSQTRWGSYSKQEQAAIVEKGEGLVVAMVGHPDNVITDPDIQMAVEQYFHYVNESFYPCSLDRYRGLADMWVEDPKFAEKYNAIRSGGAQFARDAVHWFWEKKTSAGS